MLMHEQSKEFTSIAELKQIEVLLNSLESKLHYFYQLLPRPDIRRGMINMGGWALKALFGTATTGDIFHLHQALDKLQGEEADIVHSLENQITYIRNLELSSRVNSQAISNLSVVVKDFMVQSHDRFYELTRDIMWLNLTVYSQSRVYMAVRQLEFALLQLTQQMDELLAAVQYTLNGKLAVTLVNPTTLQNILRNISLHLPDNYELAAGTQRENVHMYYDLITVAVIGDIHSIKLIMNIPLRTAEQNFDLYKLIAMPTLINGDKFVKYFPEYSYFGLSISRRDYVLLKNDDLRQCNSGSLRVCRLNVPLFDAQTLSCESSLYFQNEGETPLCKRSILLNYKTPTLQKHGATWVYNLPTRQEVTFRCHHGTSWVTHRRALLGGGLIHNATTCAVATEQVRTLPELRRTNYIYLDTPTWHVPELTAEPTHQESLQRKEDLPAAVKDLDDIKARLATPLHSIDLDTYFQIRHLSRSQENQFPWYPIIITTVCASTILLLLGYMLRSRLCHLFRKSPSNDPLESNQVPQPSPRTAAPEYATLHEKKDQRPSENVTFTNYALQVT